MKQTTFLSPRPSPTKQLRYMQREAIDAIYKYFQEKIGNPLISMATGTGKAFVIAAFCKEAIEQWPDTNIIVATSVKELVAQNYTEMIELWYDAPATIYSAGVGVKDLSGKIIFAGIQSIYKKTFNIHHSIDLLIIDEVQDVSETDGTMFRKFIADLKIANPHLKVIGLSATVYRLSQGMLTDGKNALFDEVIYDYGMLQGITDGYLSPLVSKAMTQQFELGGVGIKSGDYIPGQLEKAVDKPEVTKAVVDELVRYGEERKCWLIFCVGVIHAEHVRDEVRSRGYNCEMITAKTPKEERDRIFRQYKAGEIRCVTNVGVMTKGTNVPHIDLISMLRPTKSAGLLVQMAGRGTRLSPGKQNCLILDHAGLLAEHGPLDMVKPKNKREKGEGVAPTKTCPECKTIVFAGCMECPECAHIFEREAIKINTESTTDAVLSTQLRVESYTVTHVSYYRHQKEGKPDSLRVEYMCGLKHSFRTWVCLQHSGLPRSKACLWWHQAAGTRAPTTVTEALERVKELKMPKSVSVKKVGTFWEVVGVEM